MLQHTNQHTAAHHNSAQHSTAQHSTAQHSTTKRCAVLCCADGNRQLRMGKTDRDAIEAHREMGGPRDTPTEREGVMAYGTLLTVRVVCRSNKKNLASLTVSLAVVRSMAVGRWLTASRRP